MFAELRMAIDELEAHPHLVKESQTLQDIVMGLSLLTCRINTEIATTSGNSAYAEKCLGLEKESTAPMQVIA